MSTDVLILTAEDLFDMPKDGYRYELVEGVLRKMSPAGGEHGAIGLSLGARLITHVRKNLLGMAYGPDTGFKIRTNPDTVLVPDIAFVVEDRIQSLSDDRKYLPFAPDLAIEVLSPGDPVRQAILKANEWLSAGTRAVILIDPRTKSVSVYRPAEAVTLLTELDVLQVSDIVPGWSISVAEIFDLKSRW